MVDNNHGRLLLKVAGEGGGGSDPWTKGLINVFNAHQTLLVSYWGGFL